MQPLPPLLLLHVSLRLMLLLQQQQPSLVLPLWLTLLLLLLAVLLLQKQMSSRLLVSMAGKEQLWTMPAGLARGEVAGWSDCCKDADQACAGGV